MPNIWEWYDVDRYGERRRHESRGPQSATEMRQAAIRLLDAQRRRAWETGVDMVKDDPFPSLTTDPDKHVVDVKPIGTDQTSGLGDWKPRRASPWDINRYANRDAETGEPLFAPPVPVEEAERGAGAAVKNEPLNPQ